MYTRTCLHILYTLCACDSMVRILPFQRHQRESILEQLPTNHIKIFNHYSSPKVISRYLKDKKHQLHTIFSQNRPSNEALKILTDL